MRVCLFVDNSFSRLMLGLKFYFLLSIFFLCYVGVAQATLFVALTMLWSSTRKVPAYWLISTKTKHISLLCMFMRPKLAHLLLLKFMHSLKKGGTFSLISRIMKGSLLKKKLCQSTTNQIFLTSLQIRV